MSIIDAPLAIAIRRLRYEEGKFRPRISQVKLAKKSGLNATQLCLWEKGVGIPTVTQLAMLLKAAGVSRSRFDAMVAEAGREVT